MIFLVLSLPQWLIILKCRSLNLMFNIFWSGWRSMITNLDHILRKMMLDLRCLNRLFKLYVTRDKLVVKTQDIIQIPFSYPKSGVLSWICWDLKALMFLIGFLRLNNLFVYYNTLDEQRLTIAAIHMDKEVVPWF